MADLTRAEAVAELRAQRCGDEIQRQAIERACGIVASSAIAERLDELDVVVVDPGTASRELLESPCYTRSLKSLLRESVVVVNLRFLAEIEAAIRALGSAGSFFSMPQLRSDEALFDLVRSLRPLQPEGLARRRPRPDPWPQLTRLRRLTTGYGAPSREGDREEDIREELSLVVLFFVAHEVGHLLDGKDSRSFGAFLPPGADLEHRAANAIVRLARHVDDLAAREHDLPGFADLTDPDSEVRASVAKMESTLGDAPAQHEAWFAEEASADDWANKIIDEHLGHVEAEDQHAAARSAYLLCRGVFSSALYAWYADLLTFCDAIGIDGLTNARSLVFAMTRDRHNYIRAASLFGEIHRSTLMRAEIALETVLQNRSDWFEHCEWSRSKLDASGPERAGIPALEKWWLEETVLRFCLLGIVVDTAVKLACVGAASSWFEEKHGGEPPVFIMNFESIDRAVSRVGRKGG